MKNKWRFFAVTLAVVLCMTVFSVTVYAGGDMVDFFFREDRVELRLKLLVEEVFLQAFFYRIEQGLPPEGHHHQRSGHPRRGYRQVHRLRCLPRGLPLAHAHRQPGDRQVVQVHRLRCLRRRLPVRRSVHRGLGRRHQRSTGCLHGPVRRKNNG